jgi:hypothetical protein
MIYYTIYATINLINGNFYIGMHKTENPHDSYLGSGIALNKAIKKQGKHNFAKFPFEFFDNEKDMIRREQQIITSEFLKEHKDICYNMTTGGIGGFNLRCPQYLPHDHPKYIEWDIKNKQSSDLSLPKTDSRFISRVSKMTSCNPLFFPPDHPERIALTLKNKESNPAMLPHDHPKYIEWDNKNKESNKKLRGWITMNKDNKNTKIHLPQLEQYLLDGWLIGSKKRKNSNDNKPRGIIKITNGDEIKLIDTKEFFDYFKQGWALFQITRKYKD